MKEKKILIGLVWNEKSSYAINELVSSLRDIYTTSRHNINTVIADDSQDKSFVEQMLKNIPSSVHMDLLKDFSSKENYLNKYKTVQERMVNARNKIREYMLNGEYDYIFWLDGDVICPPFVINHLVAHNLDVLSAVRPQHGKMPGVFPFNPNVPRDIYEIQDFPSLQLIDWEWLCPTRIVEVSCVGFGCLLVSRSATASCEFWTKPYSPATEDILYCFDLRKMGFLTYVHTGMLCSHFYRDEPNMSGRGVDGRDERFDFGGDWSDLNEYRRHTIQWQKK